jgi:hypothetical protein
VVEVVSNTKGGEGDKKLSEYARMGVRYYVIYDPQRLIQEEALKVYELVVGEYVRKGDTRLERVGLMLVLWEGDFEGKRERWLRWCDREGEVIPTGAEAAERERERAERLVARLKALGIDPDEG